MQAHPLKVLGHRFDVWVIKCACCLFLSVLSLTERAQLLKNVFKKSTVSLYRSDSMQQNLLRKLHTVSLLSSSVFSFFLTKNVSCPKDFRVSMLNLSASKSFPSSGEQIKHYYSSLDTCAISKTSRASHPSLLRGCGNSLFILLLFINTLQ